MKNILCFGDSNTYGYKPDGSGRFDENTRWTARLQNNLWNSGYRIIEEGLCGRTTVFNDDFRAGRKGIDAIGTIIESHNPIDVIIIMLGTNDCKTRYGASAGIIARGVEQIIYNARKFAGNDVKILVISPIHLGKGVGDEGFDPEFDARSEKVSVKIAGELEKTAISNGCTFLDAAEVAEASKHDREHLDEEGHRKLAEAICGILPLVKKQEE